MFNRILAALMALALCLPLPALGNDISNSTWSETDASNNGVSPTGWTSGTMLPSQVSPTARAMMGGVKRFYDHINATVTSGGAANVQTLTYTVAPAAYVSGDRYTFIAGFTNTAATTLNVNALGAKNVKIGSTALAGSEIRSGQAYDIAYDGTQFQLLNPSVASVAWTPVLAFNGATTGITYSTQDGTYERYSVGSGSLIIVTFDMTLTSKGAATGSAGILSLPFAAIRTVPCNIGIYSGMSGITAFDGTYIASGATTINLVLPAATGTTAYTDTAFTNTTRISGSCVYPTA